MTEYFKKNPKNVLIHFTNSIENLISILENSYFRLKYCKEEFTITNDETVSKNVHPMVSFSEQNILELHTKEITYGKFGIALNPHWIIENNIQPVIYVEKNSQVAKSLAFLLKHRRTLIKGNELRLPIMTIKGFVKNTIGYNCYFDKHNFVFKTENEWRYVPTKQQTGNGYISENRSTYNQDPDKYNNRLLNYPLKFKHNEILKIFYESELDLQKLKAKFPELIELFEKANWKKNIT